MPWIARKLSPRVGRSPGPQFVGATAAVIIAAFLVAYGSDAFEPKPAPSRTGALDQRAQTDKDWPFCGHGPEGDRFSAAGDHRDERNFHQASDEDARHRDGAEPKSLLKRPAVRQALVVLACLVRLVLSEDRALFLKEQMAPMLVRTRSRFLQKMSGYVAKLLVVAHVSLRATPPVAWWYLSWFRGSPAGECRLPCPE